MTNIKFNSAGSSSLDSYILTKMFDYFSLENKLGGYEAFEVEKKKIERFYLNVAKLINCRATEVSFSFSSTLAWNQVFNSIPLSKKENIVIFENEYSSNHISILKRKNAFNDLRIVKTNKYGSIDFEDLEKKIDLKTKVLHVTHIASQCGNEFPIDAIGKVLKRKNPNSIYFIDACQSAGQKEINVKKLRCDILVASGRKYLMGPRGTAFLYVKSSLKKKLQSSILDMTSTRIKYTDNLVMNKNYRFLETFEHSPALKLGFSLAIRNTLNIGVKNINKRLIKLSKYLRLKLNENNKIYFYENANFLSGINTIDFKGYSNNEVFNYLKKNKIYANLTTSNVSYLYFKKIKKKELLRVSFNYYNTKNEIDKFAILVNNYVR